MFNKTFIIAEAGVNHNGDIEVAKKMIDVAVDAGVDAIKFQTFKAEKLVCKKAKKAKYQEISTDNQESQFEMLKRLELSIGEFKELKKYCDNKKIKFLSSPFDNDSVEELEKIGMDIYKIPSGEIENVPYLRRIGSYNKKVILSTGMCNLSDIEFAIDILRESGTKEIAILHCNTEYPTPVKDVNLRAMNSIKKAFGYPVGYSDHTKGIEIPVAAVALGANIIEKHFTLSRDMEGPDHKASLEPKELKELVKNIRSVESAMGTGLKKPSHSEVKNMPIARKSIVASKKIKKGDILTGDNITIKRPGTGISPKRWDELIGKVSIKDFEEDELIEI